jgi:signal transduction histidine kinase
LADEVELEVRPLDEGGTQLTVKDRGRGFSPEALESALLPFYTTKPEGSGVGLALVREIVDAHGGQLTLAPREGGGAVVTVTLPSKAKPLDSSTRARLTLTRG